MYHKMRFVPVLAIVVIVLFMVGSRVQAENMNVPAPRAGVVTKLDIAEADQQAALDFWTRDQISETEPLELLIDAGSPEIDVTSVNQPEIVGAYGYMVAGVSAPDADLIAQSAYPMDWEVISEAIEADLFPESPESPEGTGQVFTNYTVNNVSQLQNLYPHKWVGRLSFQTSSGTAYCSGTSISGNVMLTAAHCLYDTTNNRWYSNWVFAPAYRYGSAPYGTFAATNCWVLTTWVNLSGSYSINSWTRHDVGVCKMGRNSAGVTLNSAVGWMGREWNASYVRHFHVLGYPFKNYNNETLTDAGRYLRTCVSESFQQTTETRGTGCNYGGGISGGPWMTKYAPNVVSGFADGVNSGGYVGTKNIYGARFNSNNIVPLCNAAGC